MNVKFLKTTLAVVCVVAAGAGSWKAYQTYEMSGTETNVLFIENIEALSGSAESSRKCSASRKCYKSVYDQEKGCWVEKEDGEVSCSGSSCSRTSNGVECDGEETSC